MFRNLASALCRLNRRSLAAGGLVATGWLLAQDRPASHAALAAAQTLDAAALWLSPPHRRRVLSTFSVLVQKSRLFEGPAVSSFLLEQLCREAVRRGNAEKLLERVHHLTVYLDKYCDSAEKIRLVYSQVARFLAEATKNSGGSGGTTPHALLLLHLLLLATCRVEWLEAAETAAAPTPPRLKFPESLQPTDPFAKFAKFSAEPRRPLQTAPLTRDASWYLEKAWQKARVSSATIRNARDDPLASHCLLLLGRVRNEDVKNKVQSPPVVAASGFCRFLVRNGLPFTLGAALVYGFRHERLDSLERLYRQAPRQAP